MRSDFSPNSTSLLFPFCSGGVFKILTKYERFESLTHGLYNNHPCMVIDLNRTVSNAMKRLYF